LHSGPFARYLAGLLVLTLSACVRYVPQPVEPAAHADEYRARRLDDLVLLAWVSRWAGRPDPHRWSDRQLAVAALGLRAELRRAREEWRTAKAGERTAGARPSPGAQADVERAVSGSEGSSPRVVSLAGLFSVELGGKRGARLQQARARAAVAEGELRLSAWRIVQDVRAAVAALAAADTAVAQAGRQLDALVEVEALERVRYREASLTGAELARTGAEVQEARGQVAEAQAAVLEGRALLAGAVAVPARALDSVAVVPALGAGCGTADSVTADSLAALALTRRPEIARVLAEYAVAEADLRLEVARRYPDLDLGPGFIWDQGIHRWTLALALPGLLGLRNRAPVREAETARTAAAARVAEVQDDLLADVGVAMSRCHGAALQRVAADSQVTAAERAAALARGAYERGETSRLDPALGALAVVRAERARSAAQARLLAAGQALEAAVGGVAVEAWPDPRTDEPPRGAAKGATR
jgi:outer membrane protein TolC